MTVKPYHIKLHRGVYIDSVRVSARCFDEAIAEAMLVVGVKYEDVDYASGSEA